MLPKETFVYTYENHPKKGEIYTITGEYDRNLHVTSNFMYIESVDLDNNVVDIVTYIYNQNTKTHERLEVALLKHGLYQNQEHSSKYIIISPNADILDDTNQEDKLLRNVMLISGIICICSSVILGVVFMSYDFIKAIFQTEDGEDGEDGEDDNGEDDDYHKYYKNKKNIECIALGVHR
jgi:hypothetical protein